MEHTKYLPHEASVDAVTFLWRKIYLHFFRSKSIHFEKGLRREFNPWWYLPTKLWHAISLKASSFFLQNSLKKTHTAVPLRWKEPINFKKEWISNDEETYDELHRIDIDHGGFWRYRGPSSTSLLWWDLCCWFRLTGFVSEVVFWKTLTSF